MNSIHPTAILEGDVKLGEGNTIGPFCFLHGPLTIGDDNLVSPHVCIGTPGEDTRDRRYDSSASRIEIGNRNIIREFTAIQKACYRDATRIGSDTFLMHGVHIPHDAVIEDGVTIAPMAVVGGLSHIMSHANLGMGCSVHQYSVVGPYSIVATNAAAVKNVRPFSRFIPGQPPTLNSYAIEKFGFSEYHEEIEAFVLRNELPASKTIRTIVDRYAELHTKSDRAEYGPI